MPSVVIVLLVGLAGCTARRCKEKDVQIGWFSWNFNLSDCTSLNLGGAINAIGDQGLPALAEALKGNTILRELDLHDNYLDSDGVTLLAGALAVNTGLRTLDLSHNRLCDVWVGLHGRQMGRYEGAGVEALSAALAKNIALTSLDLSSSNIVGPAARVLAEGLRTNGGLTVVDLEDNPLTPEAMAEVEEALATPPDVRLARAGRAAQQAAAEDRSWREMGASAELIKWLGDSSLEMATYAPILRALGAGTVADLSPLQALSFKDLFRGTSAARLSQVQKAAFYAALHAKGEL